MGTPTSRSLRWAACVACVLCATLGALGAAAQTAEVEDDARDPAVLEVARRMADALSGASSLRVTAHVAYDAVQPDGQAIEFGATRWMTVRRPDRARMEVLDRTGARALLVFDGEQVVLVDVPHNAYATAEHRGDLQSMQAFVRSELRLPTPLSEFVSPDLYAILAASTSARWVDEATLDGVPCDHLAFRNEQRGLQVWVPQEGEPLPRRVVITYEDAPGRPQFRADLRDWELSPTLDDSLFTYTPAAGVERISFNVAPLPVPEETRGGLSR